MAFRGRGRPKKKVDDRGKLMIELRTRSKVWVSCEPEVAFRIMMDVMGVTTLESPPPEWVNFHPHAPSVVRREAIESMTYFPSKAVPTEPEATQP